jgi:small subunit ribosomal protein S6
MLMRDTSVEDERRAKILADVEQTIADGGGTIELKQAWGARRMAFEIDHKTDAEYDLLQFTGPPTLVETLAYNLKITDGVIRHRIIKVTPGTPPAPEPVAAEPIVAAEPVAPEAAVETTVDAPGDVAAPAEPAAAAPEAEAAAAPEAAATPPDEPESEEPAEAPAAP